MNLETSRTNTGPYKVQVLDRAVAILEILSNADQEMSLGELTTAIGLHKSTVHRLLMVLESHRLVDKSPLHGRYRPGLKLFELGSLAVNKLRLRERARPRLMWLVSQTSETVHLGVLDHREVLYIDKIEPERSIRISSKIGSRQNAHCTATGKALLAFQPERVVKAILRDQGLPKLTAKTITDPDLFMAELERTRERGYSVNDEEREEGVRSVAMPIFGSDEQVVAAIAVIGPAFRFENSRILTLLEPLRSVTAELSEHMGAVKSHLTPPPL